MIPHYPRVFMLLLSITLPSCTLPEIPKPTAQFSVIRLQAQAGQTLLAQELDDQWVNDGRYVLTTPGIHQLSIRFQYSRYQQSIHSMSEQTTCIIRVQFNTEADQQYVLTAKPLIGKGAQLQLTLAGHRLEISPISQRCGPF